MTYQGLDDKDDFKQSAWTMCMNLANSIIELKMREDGTLAPNQEFNAQAMTIWSEMISGRRLILASHTKYGIVARVWTGDADV